MVRGVCGHSETPSEAVGTIHHHLHTKRKTRTHVVVVAVVCVCVFFDKFGKCLVWICFWKSKFVFGKANTNCNSVSIVDCGFVFGKANLFLEKQMRLCGES